MENTHNVNISSIKTMVDGTIRLSIDVDKTTSADIAKFYDLFQKPSIMIIEEVKVFTELEKLQNEESY